MYNSIFDVKGFEEFHVDCIEIQRLNFEDEKEFIKLLKILKRSIQVIVVETKIKISYEQSKLYEAIVFSNIDTKDVYKKIISTIGNDDINVEFDNYLLPIGSVVRLDANKDVLIVSRIVEGLDGVCDYSGCDNKVGYNSNNLINFNHSGIIKIHSLPYEDANTIASTIGIKKMLDSRKGENNGSD